MLIIGEFEVVLDHVDFYDSSRPPETVSRNAADRCTEKAASMLVSEHSFDETTTRGGKQSLQTRYDIDHSGITDAEIWLIEEDLNNPGYLRIRVRLPYRIIRYGIFLEANDEPRVPVLLGIPDF
jgi:hypothetical protein